MIDTRLWRRLLLATLISVALFGIPHPARAQDARAGFAAIHGALVKVWAFGRDGQPIATGTGFVVDSDSAASHVITAAHVVKGAASVKIDLNSDIHDLPATVLASYSDVAVLSVQHGSLRPVTFAQRPVQVGDTFATAGYYREDEARAQIPRLLYPSTISAITNEGRVIAFDNVNIQEGLSGAPVFNPSTGTVVGMISSRSEDGRGGYALSSLPIAYFLKNEQNLPVALDIGTESAAGAMTLHTSLPQQPVAFAPTPSAPTASNSAYVDDTAHVLSDATIGELAARSAAFEAATGFRIVVYTTPELYGESAKEVAERVFRQKRIVGALIFIALRERQDGILPDQSLGRILSAGDTTAARGAMRDYFRKGDFDAGLSAGLDALIARYNARKR